MKNVFLKTCFWNIPCLSTQNIWQTILLTKCELVICPGLHKSQIKITENLGRHGRVMVSELDSWSSCLGSSPGQGHCIAFLGKAILTVPLSCIKEYRWVLVNYEYAKLKYNLGQQQQKILEIKVLMMANSSTENMLKTAR